MAVDSGTYTDDTLLRRKKIAEAMLTGDKPIRHWAEGLAEVGKGLIGGYQFSKAEDMERAKEDAGTAQLYAMAGLPAPAGSQRESQGGFQRLASLMSGGGETAPASPVPPPAPPVAAPSVAASAPSSAGKIYSNDEPSPLDPPSGQDRTRMIATILGESANQPAVGQNAVASVIRNRAVAGNYGGDTPSGVVTAKNQFEPWNTAGGRSKMETMAADPALAAKADAAIAMAYGEGGNAPNDPTNGAKNFIQPKLQTDLGRPMPAWAQQPGVMIGDHKFIGGAPQDPAQQPYQVAGPATAAPQAPVAQAMTPPQMPASGMFANVPKEQLLGILQGLTSKNPTMKALAVQQLGVYAKRDPLDIEAKKLDIETKKKGLTDAPNVQRVKQTDGSEVAVQWDPKAQQWAPLKAPEGGNSVATPKLTEQQSKDVGFYNRGQKLLPRLEQQDKELTDLASTAGGKVSNYLKTDAFRQAEQTGKELLAVILRKDTGAAVTPSEMEQYSSIYLPRPGDDAATVQQKRVARATAIEGLRLGLGPAEIIFKSREAAEAAKGTPAANTNAAPAAPDRPAIEAEMRKRGLLK